MIRRDFKPFVLLALLFLCIGPVYATTCGRPPAEEAEMYARQDGWNVFVKGFLWGLILSAYLFNIGWFIYRTKRWVTAGLFSLLLCVPIVSGFFFAEMLSQGCGFSGIDARYYVIPLAALILIAIGQKWDQQSGQKPAAMFPD